MNSYEEAYQTNCFYIFTQELATEGDLLSFIDENGLSENECKIVAKQISNALQFMHSKGFVHQSVHLENINVFNHDLSLVKLGEFSCTRPTGKLVKKNQNNNPWEPPEICEAVLNEGYYPNPAQDAWQLGILIFACLTGTYPWNQADITDADYNAWIQWQKRKTTKIPPQFRQFSPRLLRLLRRLLEPKVSRRAEVQEVQKYLSDIWIEKSINSVVVSLSKRYSRMFHTSPRSSVDTSCSNDSLKSQFYSKIPERTLCRQRTFHI